MEHAAGSTTCVARATGDLDAHSVPDLQAQVDSAVTGGCRIVVCDLSDVTYMDSSALGFLVWADRRLGPVSGRLVLTGANDDVARIIDLSGLIGMVPSILARDTLGEALATPAPPSSGSRPEWKRTFSFPADASRMGEMRARIHEVCAPLCMPDSSLFDLKVAAGEAIANAIRHGSPRGPRDEVCLEVEAYPDRVVVTVSDSGCGFDGQSSADPSAYASNGRGVLFMRALADAVEFRGSVSGGTSVRLAKRRMPDPGFAR